METQIHLTVTDGELTAQSDPGIISDNTGYTLLVDITPAPSGTAFISLDIEHDGINTTVERALTGELDLPAFPAAFGANATVRIEPAEEGAEAITTNTIWLPIEASIKGQRSMAYTAPYDAYNDIMRYVNTADKTTREAVVARLTYHAEHPEPYPGTAYKRAMTAPSRYTRLRGTLTPRSGEERQITENDIKSNTLAVSTSATGESYLLPGGVPSAQLDLTLSTRAEPESLHGAEIAPVFEVALETDRWFRVPLGVFTVAAENDGSTSGVALTAYDDMHRLDAVRADSLGFGAFVAYSPGQIISKICIAGGIAYTEHVDHNPVLIGREIHGYVCVLLGDPDDPEMQDWATVIQNAEDLTPEEIQARLDTLTHGEATFQGDVGYPSELPTPGDGSVTVMDAYRVGYDGPTYIAERAVENLETARDLLMHTVFTLGGIAQIDAERKLVVRPIAAIAQAGDAELIDTGQTTSRRVSRYPYELHSMTSIVDYYENDKLRRSARWTGETLADIGVDAEAQTNAVYTATIEDDAWTAITGELSGLLGRLASVTYYPMQIAMRGDPTIGLLDWIRTDETHAAPVTARFWRYRGTQTLTACGEEAVAGAVRTQLEKQIASDRLAVSEALQETLRQSYLQQMQTYAGLGTFRYREIERYTFAELGGET